MTPPTIPDRQRKLEILAVFITGVGKFICMDYLLWKLPFIIIAIIGWSCYVLYRRRRTKGVAKYWGFRTDNFWTSARMVMPFGMVALISCFTIGFYRETLNLSWHIIPILLIYPIWGIIQQFLVIALVAGNLTDLSQNRLPMFFIILVTAILFGALHYPSYWLIIGTFILALFYGYIYLRCRNVYVMGIFHGWLGAIFFYTVVGRDPFAEVFGRL